MPVYQFDTELRGKLLRDTGFLLGSDEEARSEAILGLFDLAQELPPTNQPSIKILVRRGDTLLLTLSISFGENGSYKGQTHR